MCHVLQDKGSNVVFMKLTSVRVKFFVQTKSLPISDYFRDISSLSWRDVTYINAYCWVNIPIVFILNQVLISWVKIWMYIRFTSYYNSEKQTGDEI